MPSANLLIAISAIGTLIVTVVALILTLRRLRDQLWLQTFSEYTRPTSNGFTTFHPGRVTPAGSSSWQDAKSATSPLRAGWPLRAASCIVSSVRGNHSPALRVIATFGLVLLLVVLVAPLRAHATDRGDVSACVPSLMPFLTIW